MSRPKGHNTAGRIRSIEKSSELIANRTSDLPACNIAPQPTTLLRSPEFRRNIDQFGPGCMAPRSIRRYFSYSPSWEPQIQHPYACFSFTCAWIFANLPCCLAVKGDAREKSMPRETYLHTAAVQDGAAKTVSCKVKANLSLCLIKHYAMKAYGGVDVQIHITVSCGLRKFHMLCLVCFPFYTLLARTAGSQCTERRLSPSVCRVSFPKLMYWFRCNLVFGIYTKIGLIYFWFMSFLYNTFFHEIKIIL
jgi:hypothetical protein